LLLSLRPNSDHRLAFAIKVALHIGKFLNDDVDAASFAAWRLLDSSINDCRKAIASGIAKPSLCYPDIVDAVECFKSGW
jgi:hypothetical protein